MGDGSYSWWAGRCQRCSLQWYACTCNRWETSCVVHEENCSITCMTVATEVAVFAESVFHIFYCACRERGGSTQSGSTCSECSPVIQMCAVVSYTFPVMEERRALISHIFTRKGHSCPESCAHHHLVLWRTWVAACSFTVNLIPWCILH